MIVPAETQVAQASSAEHAVTEVYNELLALVQLAAADLELERRAQRQAIEASIAAALEQVHST